MTNILNFLKDWLSKDQPLLTNIGVIIGLVAAGYGFIHLSWKGIRALYHLFNRESLYHRLKPYFTRHEIRGAIDNYIPTQCQNVDPSKQEEPSFVHAFATREKLVPFFIKKVFREKKEEKYYLVLADSGMGKTTFMINLFLTYMRKRFKPFHHCHMVLLPLGHPKTDERIDAIGNKTETILLLDAFDEDIAAGKDYKSRMDIIIDKTSDFQTVIITSRTQFFPSDPAIPEETGLYKYGGAKGVQTFYRLYVSPFNGKDINRYLRRKYPFYLWFKRRKARAIVDKSPNLMVRPMLLANIEALLERREPYKYTFEIYEEMVERWIQRELVKDKAELRKFSEAIAVDMYNNRQQRGGLFIDGGKIGQFAQEYGFRLEEMEMRSRSLLNRNAEGKYKFAHKSILEYLLSLEIIRDPSFRRTFNFDNMEQTRFFYKEQFLPKLVIPFFSRPLNGSFRLFVKKDGSSNSETRDIDIKKLDLNEMENISMLDLDRNQLSDITALSELKNIQSLSLGKNQLTDITPLMELKKIQKLQLFFNQLTDITPLKELKKIQELDLSSNRLTDITPLKELENIQELNLYINQFTDITPLKELKNIHTLRLDCNQLTDITTLKELKSIQKLYLSFNQLTDITPLKELKNIQKLSLENNQLTDITPLRELKNIQELNLSFNRLTDITPLEELINIQELNLSSNRLTDITPLKELKNIHTLWLDNNQLTDITPLKELKNLKLLYLSGNPIKDNDTIEELSRELKGRGGKLYF